MIFKTITDESTGAIKSIGLFGKTINGLKQSLSNVKINGLLTTVFNTSSIDVAVITKYNEEIIKATASGATMVEKQQIMKIAMDGTNQSTAQLIATTNGATVSVESLTAAQKSSTLAAKAHSAALKVVSIAGNMILFTVIAKGIQLATKAIDDYIHRVERSRERTEELLSEFKKMNDTLADHKKTVSELADRYDELSKGVSLSTNDNVSLSTEEYEEFLDINEQLAQSFPELAKGIDENGNSILTLGTKGITAKEQLEELLQTEEDLNNFRIAQGLEDAFKGVYTYVEDANKATETLNGSISDSSEAMGKLQDIAENGIKLSGENSQLIFAGNINNQAELDYMNSLTQSVNEFWKSLDGNRRVELDINPSDLFTQNMDEYSGAFEIYTNLYQLTPEEITALENIIQDNVGDASGALRDSISDQSQELQEQINKGENAWRDFLPNLVSGMKSKQTFKDLDSDLQDIAVQIIEGLDYSYASAMKAYDPDPYAYIRDKFIIPISKLSDDDKQKLQSNFKNLLKLDADNLAKSNQAEIERLIAIIADLLDKEPLEIRMALGFNTEDVQNRYNEALKQAKRQLDGYSHDDRGFEINNVVGNQIDSFWSENVVTEEDLGLWKKVTAGIDDATEATNAYTEAKKNANSVKPDETGNLSISQTISQLNTQLKPVFDSLKSAYQNIFTDGSYNPDAVDIPMLDSIKSSIEELNKLESVDINIDMGAFDTFTTTLEDANTTGEQVRQAFRDFAASIFFTSNATDGMTEETKGLVEQLLESLGVVNAAEVAEYALAEAKAKEMLAAYDVIHAKEEEYAAILAEGTAAGVARQQLYRLMAAEIAFGNNGLSVEEKINKLKGLATQYGDTASAALATVIANDLANGHTDVDSAINDLMAQINAGTQIIGIDFGNVGGGSRAAGSAGKEAAATYLEAFEKELKDLDDLKSRGKITEKQYLDALRHLYLKYFRDKEEYLKEYEKYEHQYLDGMKSLYESAFSYITKQIDRRIDTINAEKDAAVSALEAERDARLEAIEAQKGQLENEIEGIEKEIEAKEKEIKAMQDANGERKRAIGLQKAEYDLQRMQNQKASLVYKDGQVSYEADTSGIRDAKQEVEDAKLEIDISKIEKEIGLLEEQKDLLQEQIDLLDKEADRVNDYYDKLIAGTEKQYDAMVKGMEEYRSQFEELLDLFENARLEATLSELGVNMDALLNGSQEEFEKMKGAYIGILADMSRGNDEIIGQLSRLAGVNAESVSYLESTKSAFENFGAVTLEGLGGSVEDIRESVSGLATSAGEASSAVGIIQEGIDRTSGSITPLNVELEKLNSLIMGLTSLLNNIIFPEIGDDEYAQKLRDIASAFGEIAVKCAEFQQIDFGSIVGSGAVMTAGNGDPLSGGSASDTQGKPGTGFMGLASAILSAVSSISEQMGILESALQRGNDAFTEQIRVITEEYIPAWVDLQKRLAEIIGVGGGDDKNGNKPSDSNGESEASDGSIIGTIESGGIEVAKKLKDPWLKAFNDFATDGDNSIQTICDKIIGLVTEMARVIQEKCKAAAAALDTLASKAASSPATKGGGGRSRGGYKGTVGDAFAGGTTKIESLPITGYKGIPHDEKNALRSEYGQPELTVYPDGTAELTTEPVISDLPKGTVIFNEEQTRRIMSNKGEMLETYADGTVRRMDGSMVKPDGEVIYPITPDDRLYWMQKKFEGYFRENKGAFIKPAHAMLKTAGPVDKAVEMVNHSNTMNRTEIAIGDIHLHEVQDADRLSDELILRLPNKILQKMHKV